MLHLYRLLVSSVLALPILLQFCIGEESSILSGPKFDFIANNEVDTAATWRSNSLIDGGFKTVWASDTTDLKSGGKEFDLVFKEPVTLITAFVQNQVRNDEAQKLMGSSRILAGTCSAFYCSSMVPCTGYFYDSGFQILSSCTGPDLAIRRDGLPSNS